MCGMGAYIADIVRVEGIRILEVFSSVKEFLVSDGNTLFLGYLLLELDDSGVGTDILISDIATVKSADDDGSHID